MNENPNEKMSQEEIWAALNEDIPHEELRAYLPFGRDWKGMFPPLKEDIKCQFSNGLPKITLLIEADVDCDCYLLAFDFRLGDRQWVPLSNPRDLSFGCHGVRVCLWVLPVRRCDGRAFQRNEEKHVYRVECEISDVSPGHFDDKRQEAVGPYAVPPHLPSSIKTGKMDYVAEYVDREKGKEAVYACDYVATKATAKAQAEALKMFCVHYQPLFPEATAQLLPLFRKPSKRKPQTTTHTNQLVARQLVSKHWDKYNADCRAYFGRPTYKEFWENSDWQPLLQKAGIQTFEQLKKVIHSLRMAKYRNREK